MLHPSGGRGTGRASHYCCQHKRLCSCTNSNKFEQTACRCHHKVLAKQLFSRDFAHFGEVCLPLLYCEHHFLHDTGLCQDDVKVLGVVLQVERLLVDCHQVVAMIIPHFGPIHSISVLMHDINFSRWPIHGT